MQKKKIKIKIKKKVIGWDLWKNGVSQSFIMNFLTCRYQAHLYYEKNWRSNGTSLPLEFGNVSHWIFSEIYTMKKTPTKSTIEKLITTYEEQWRKENRFAPQNQRDKQERVYGMAAQLFPEYVKRWNGDWTGKYEFGNDTVAPKKWLDLEGRYELPYIYPDGKETFLLAVFDGIFYDKKKNLWLYESKTKGRIDEELLQDMILYDTQVMLELWIAGNIFKIPAGVLYNVTRRPGQKRYKDETMKSYLGRIKKDVSNPKRYDHYFKRWEFGIDWSEVKQWKEDFLDPVMQEIRMWVEGDLATYISPTGLVNRWGRCDLFAPIVKKDFSNCTQRKEYRRHAKK